MPHAVLWMPEGTLTVTKTPTGCHVLFTPIKGEVVSGDAQTDDIIEFTKQLEGLTLGN